MEEGTPPEVVDKSERTPYKDTRTRDGRRTCLGRDPTPTEPHSISFKTGGEGGQSTSRGPELNNLIRMVEAPVRLGVKDSFFHKKRGKVSK